MKTRLVIAGVVIAALAVVMARSMAGRPRQAAAQNFKATTLAGKQFELKDLRGRVVLLDFWATWCPPCRAEVPELQKLWQRHKDQGLVVIGVALDRGGSDGVRSFAQEAGITYWLVHDDQGALARKYGVRPIPTGYVISPAGVISHTHIGFEPGMEKQLEREIKALLPSPEQLQQLPPLPA